MWRPGLAYSLSQRSNKSGHKNNDNSKRGSVKRLRALEPFRFQDLVDVLPDIIKAAAGLTLRFELSVTLGDGDNVPPEMLNAVNNLLEEVSQDLTLKP